MKRFVAVVLFALVASVPLRAQWDTATLRLNHLRPVPMVTGTSLIAAGSVLAFSPTVHELAVKLRDEVMYHDLPKLHFDDYIQYATTAAPVALNLCGLKSRHPLSRMMMLEGASYLLGAGWLNFGKYGFEVLRPDNSAKTSFPSGHTFMAFTGAEVLRREYGEEYPIVAIAGYAVASVVALMRIYNNRHWAGDVLAGAGLGIVSVTLTYWFLD